MFNFMPNVDTTLGFTIQESDLAVLCTTQPHLKEKVCGQTNRQGEIGFQSSSGATPLSQ